VHETRRLSDSQRYYQSEFRYREERWTVGQAVSFLSLQVTPRDRDSLSTEHHACPHDSGQYSTYRIEMLKKDLFIDKVIDRRESKL
jgi:hypothetical protein